MLTRAQYRIKAAIAAVSYLVAPPDTGRTGYVQISHIDPTDEEDLILAGIAAGRLKPYEPCQCEVCREHDKP